MATMKYCAYENTADDMQVAVEKARETDIEDLDVEEMVGLRRLIRLTKELLDAIEIDEAELSEKIAEEREMEHWKECVLD